MSTAIWWVRRDLRLGDNQALRAAMSEAGAVIPVFIIDPSLMTSPYASLRRLDFLYEGLHLLDLDLSRRGSRLIVREGEPLQALRRLLEETGATGIYAEADVSPYARKRDEKVRRELPLKLKPGVTVHPPETLLKADGSPYTVFTPFKRMWHSLPFPGNPHPAPDHFPSLPAINSLELPEAHRISIGGSFPAGEAEAQRRLEQFTGSAISQYDEDRNRMDIDGTSCLSPYLRLGMLSARQAAWAAREASALANDAASMRGAEAWLNELVWREFYLAILYHFPFVRQTAFRPALRHIRWREDAEGFAAWCEGRTGFPVVDAGIRQLNASGWMHNRARMITASFLTKDLLIDWSMGEKYFMQHLIDGDPAANNGGWQWTAGTGTDAAPYFRVFNPTLQGKKFDPQGDYVRRWVPELQSVPNEYIHEPWKMSADEQSNVGCVIGRDYPFPIVDHAMARQRVVAVYRGGEL